MQPEAAQQVMGVRLLAASRLCAGLRLGRVQFFALAYDAVVDGGEGGDGMGIEWLALLARSRPLWLVIDDWQNVTDAQANGLLQTLLDFAPPALHLLMVSRSVPELSLARLRDQCLLEELGPAELRFSLEEVQQYVAQI